jgi:hypothetical protein
MAPLFDSFEISDDDDQPQQAAPGIRSAGPIDHPDWIMKA